jgi:Mn-containing catalase
MFHHVKELQFNARVSRPDPKFAALLQEQFGGGNGELKAAMQYFTQAFSVRQTYPDKYDMLMDIATEEFSHLEIVGATITMLMGSLNGELKNAAESKNLGAAFDSDVTKLASGGKAFKEQMIHDALMNPEALVNSGGGPTVTNSRGVPWSGAFVNANGDLTVDLRSNIAAESRAKIVYEYLMQFTDDPLVKESLSFLMTREIAHFQMFAAALETIQPNFPPGVLQGDPRYTHVYTNLSNGGNIRGPWNQGQGPWCEGEQWTYVEHPQQITPQRASAESQGSKLSVDDAQELDRRLSQERSKEVLSAMPKGENSWENFPKDYNSSTKAPSRADIRERKAS